VRALQGLREGWGGGKASYLTPMPVNAKEIWALVLALPPRVGPSQRMRP
jgi:hypothetical protein